MALSGRAYPYQHQIQHQHQHQRQQQMQPEHSAMSLDARRAGVAITGPGAAAYAFEDDDDDSNSSILDPAVLDPESMHRHDRFRFRKDSFANSNGVLSPAESHTWDPHFANALPNEPASAGTSRFHEDNNNAFSTHQMSHQHNPFASSSHQPLSANTWNVAHASGDSTPTTSIDLMPPPPSFDALQFTQQSRLDGTAPQAFDHSRTHQQHAFPPSAIDRPFIAPPQVQTPISPQSHQEWMALAQQESEARSMSKRMRPHSPRSVVDLRVHDGGIHKKNKRIDIPQERNIQTIDQMIEDTKDEELLKELKAQKRLLRNREAALASRQRKKKHTEDLETKEKSYQSQISTLEQQIEALAIERNTLSRDRQILIHRAQEAERIIEAGHMEKRDLIMKHTEETASLRRKVQVLSEQIEAAPAPAMSAVPSSTGYADFAAGMEALSMVGPHEWDNFINVNDLQHDGGDDFYFDQPHPEMTSDVDQKTANTTALVSASTQPSTSESATEQPVASGLLFMLLLCGAFVASRPTISSNTDLPPMPADVRAAAPTVLNSLLAESAAPAASLHARTMVNTASREPAALHHIASRSRPANRMDHIHKHLTAPSKQQQIESAFALTTSQYASLHDSDYPLPEQDHQLPQPRRTLAEALAEYQPADTGTKAAIYGRSLLMSQVPAHVVEQFTEMVRAHSELEAHGQTRQSHDA